MTTPIPITAKKKNYLIVVPEKMKAETQVFESMNLVDESGNQLVDESSNLLVGQTLVSSYAYQIIAPKKSYTIVVPEKDYNITAKKKNYLIVVPERDG